MTGLSEPLRDELASIAPRRRCCRLAELSALSHTAGTWHLHGRGERSVHLDLVSAAVARRAFSLLRGFLVGSEIRTYQQHAFAKATRYQLHVELDEGAIAVLREAGVVSASGAPLEVVPKQVVGRSCCRASYLRGAILGAGSLSGPRAPHLEIRASHKDGAAFLVALADAEDCRLAVAERRGQALAYAKGGETIVDLLALIGASQTALLLDEHAVLAGTRSEANRLANADAANVGRVVRASREQIEAIEALAGHSLPPHLAVVAELRVRHPALSLAELGLRSKPPIPKATIAARMRQIRALASEITDLR